ncbi:MAG: hypothetical protein NWF03_06385 [Candidatus Bathyarchaeota archaeon]|nr:hypothetical protein [Candidatus Bathyarchaeota archaeon]
MNSNMKPIPKSLIVTLIMLAITVLTLYLAITNTTNSFFTQRPMPNEFGDSGGMIYYSWDFEVFYIVKTILSTINATLLVFMMITYIDMYKKLPSEFTVGLIIFSMTLLLYALVSNPLMQKVFGFYGIGLGPFAMLPDLFTFLALCVLMYLTWK